MSLPDELALDVGQLAIGEDQRGDRIGVAGSGKVRPAGVAAGFVAGGHSGLPELRSHLRLAHANTYKFALRGIAGARAFFSGRRLLVGLRFRSRRRLDGRGSRLSWQDGK